MVFSSWSAIQRVHPLDGVNRFAHAAAASLFCLLFPSPCRLCGIKLNHAYRLPVCAACLDAVEAVRTGGCRQCGDLVPTLAEDGRCLACHTSPPAYRQALAASGYGGVARELILQLKFGGLRPAAAYWARRLEPLARALPAGAPALVVPVPLGRRRQRQRGYNQSAEIARPLARQLGCACVPRALRRRRETSPQSGLDRAARIRNLEGAFVAAPLVAGRRVLLIDDVLTTGATAHAAAAALCRAGAAEVYVLTAARAELEFPDLNLRKGAAA